MIVNCSCDFLSNYCKFSLGELYCTCVEGVLTECRRVYGEYNSVYITGIIMVFACVAVMCCMIRNQKEEEKPPAYNKS